MTHRGPFQPRIFCVILCVILGFMLQYDPTVPPHPHSAPPFQTCVKARLHQTREVFKDFAKCRGEHYYLHMDCASNLFPLDRPA